MSLRALAEQDLAVILEDSTSGFGFPITLTDPQGNVDSFIGMSDDIAQIIDPETGQVVSGRGASIALRISTLVSKGFALPQGIADASLKPWIVEFNDIGGTAHKFKVMQSNPDRTLGLVTCLLELYS